MAKNILLINPAINPASQNLAINKVINKTFPVSLGVLASVLIDSKIASVDIIDEQIDFIIKGGIENLILSLDRPRIIGMSVMAINSKRAYELCALIKNYDPGALVVLGGIHPTVLPEEALARPGVDVVVRGEGEEAFKELVSLAIENKDYTMIPGISYVKDSRFIHNPAGPVISNLDEIPSFPYYLFEKNKDKYPTFAAIATSRGCPYGCIFCAARSVSGKQYRYFSIERVISEIKLLAFKYNEKAIWLMDDDIATNRARFLKLLDAIKDAGLPEDVYFHGSMRADNIDDEILNKAKKANFKMIAFGMETGSESLMKIINKGESVKQVTDAIVKTEQKGISVATTIIFGLPGEIRKDRWDTIRMVNKLPLSSVRFNILTPYPDTPVFEALRKEIFIKKDWENFAVQYLWEGDDLPYVPRGNNVYELIFDTMFANLSFYFSLKGVKRAMKASFAGGNVIKVPGRWYLSPVEVWGFIRVVSYLICRFSYIVFKVCLAKAKINKNAKYKPIKEILDSFTGCNGDKESISSPDKNKLFYNLESLYLEKVFENVIYEKYRDIRRPLFTYLPFNYQRIHRGIRYYLQGFFRSDDFVRTSVFPSWPLEDSLERIREVGLNGDCFRGNSCFKKLAWPENKKYSLILTHDIESSDNWKWVKVIAEIERGLGLRSCWNVVPGLYKIDYNTLDWLVSNGFEIGLHGYNHDNKMIFLPEKRIRSRIESSRNLINKYKIKGFRSPSWLRNEKLFKILQDYFIYDCSVLDVDYISPTGAGGCCSVFPYRINRLVELPTTLPYEFPIQLGVARGQLNSFWSKKINWIKSIKGALVVITHPDPYYSGSWDMVNIYRQFLEGFKQDDDIICKLPHEIAEYYNACNL